MKLCLVTFNDKKIILIIYVTFQILNRFRGILMISSDHRRARSPSMQNLKTRWTYCIKGNSRSKYYCTHRQGMDALEFMQFHNLCNGSELIMNKSYNLYTNIIHYILQYKIVKNRAQHLLIKTDKNQTIHLCKFKHVRICSHSYQH